MRSYFAEAVIVSGAAASLEGKSRTTRLGRAKELDFGHGNFLDSTTAVYARYGSNCLLLARTRKLGGGVGSGEAE